MALLHASPAVILSEAKKPLMKIFVRLPGTFNVNMPINLFTLEETLKYQTLNQPMIIIYEVYGYELFILSINIQM
jgi:hypothetical protein